MVKISTYLATSGANATTYGRRRQPCPCLLAYGLELPSNVVITFDQRRSELLIYRSKSTDLLVQNLGQTGQSVDQPANRLHPIGNSTYTSALLEIGMSRVLG